MKKLGLSFSIGALVALVSTTPTSAIEYGGVEFPDGISSFADVVVDYSPVINASGHPTAPYRNANEAIGAPDYSSSSNDGYVSLGSGGSITLRFTDNSLTGSGTPAADLWIFEIGPDVEDTFVEISKNGVNWIPVGSVTGSTSFIDIDFYGYGPTDFFSFVRLTDDPTKDATTGVTVGADIDAVGAISSAPPVTTVPEAGSSLALLALGATVLTLLRRRNEA